MVPLMQDLPKACDVLSLSTEVVPEEDGRKGIGPRAYPLLQEDQTETTIFWVHGSGLWMRTSLFRVEFHIVGCDNGFCMLAESAGLT